MTPTEQRKVNRMAGRIRKLTKDSGMSYSEFAKAVGISKAHVANIVHGKAVPSVMLAGKISRLFGVSLDWLVHG